MSATKIPHFHAYWPFKGQTTRWLSTDSEELYRRNLRNRSTEMERLGWVDREIIYHFNSDGFRSAEFDQGPGVVFLGCSHTMGIGLPHDETWTSQVAESLDLSCWNLGLGGASNDVAFRMAWHWLPRLRPKICVLMCPDSSRLEIVQDDYFSLQMIPGGGVDLPEFKAWYVSDYNSQINALKNVLAIDHVCRGQGIKFLAVTVENHMIKVDGDLARDLCHWGRESHRLTAKMVLESLD